MLFHEIVTHVELRLDTQVTSASSPVRLKLRTVARNRFGFWIWNVVLVADTEPRILRWRLDFWKICAVPQLRYDRLYILWTVYRDTHMWERPTRCTLFLNNFFSINYPDMFRRDNRSSSGGLYKQLTVFHNAFLWGV